MKIYRLIFILFFIILFTGCFNQNEPTPYVKHEVTEVYVPTKAKRPNIECSLDTEDEMFDCIVLQKRIIEELTE